VAPSVCSIVKNSPRALTQSPRIRAPPGSVTAGAKPAPPAGHEHFGFVLVACEGADLRLTATGVEVYEPDARRTVELPVGAATRGGVIDELWGAIVEGRPPIHDGAWGEENLAVCLAILRSAHEGREIELEHRP
jgi:phthalate 4,5-cis-dihydrodiol dehydrogenase